MAGAIAYLKTALPHDDPTQPVAISENQRPIIRDLGNGLCVAYLEDRGQSFRYVNVADFDAAGCDIDAFHALCVENLADIARAKLSIRAYNGCYVMIMDGNFEASLILVDNLWDETLAHLAPTGFVAALPARDILAFCDAQSQAGLAELRQIVARLQSAPQADHLLRPELFRRVGKSWEPLP